MACMFGLDPKHAACIFVETPTKMTVTKVSCLVSRVDLSADPFAQQSLHLGLPVNMSLHVHSRSGTSEIHENENRRAVEMCRIPFSSTSTRARLYFQGMHISRDQVALLQLLTTAVAFILSQLDRDLGAFVGRS